MQALSTVNEKEAYPPTYLKHLSQDGMNNLLQKGCLLPVTTGMIWTTSLK